MLLINKFFRRYWQLTRHCCKTPGRISKTGISDFKAISTLHFPSPNPQLHPKACLFLTSAILHQPGVWLWLQVRKQPICSIQRGRVKNKTSTKGFSLIWYFTKFIWRKGRIVFLFVFFKNCLFTSGWSAQSWDEDKLALGLQALPCYTQREL